MGFIQFFHLGYFKDYLIYGLIIGVLFAIYVFFKSRVLFTHFHKSPKSKLAITIRLILAATMITFTYNPWGLSMQIAFYFIICNLISDFIHLIIWLISKRNKRVFELLNTQLLVTILAFTIFLAFGRYNINHIVNTTYEVTNSKGGSELNVVLITDLHYGTIQSKNRLKEKIDEINNTNPDVVVLGGDITDERVSLSDMEDCYETLGKLKSTYGTFFVFGNHDRQVYETDYLNGQKQYTEAQLTSTITKNGIKILQDGYVVIGDYVLIGREDAGWDNEYSRTPIADLLNGVDKNKYIIVVDHQPLEQTQLENSGVSLELSGHTHHGQLFPWNILTSISAKYSYGKYEIGNLTQIVSSGYAGWGWPVRNTGKCEYVSIKIK